LLHFSDLFQELLRLSLLALLVGVASLAVTTGCRTAVEQPVLGYTSPPPTDHSPSDPLSGVLELGSRNDDIRWLLKFIATGFFGDRLEVDPAVTGSFKGETGRTSVAEALDTICSAAHCKWRVKGDPPTLVVEPASR